MRRIPLAASGVLMVFTLTAFVQGGEVQLHGTTFQIPDGFTLERVAESPLVKYPICADFDDEGRLYVAEASGAKDWNKPQPEESRHRVLRLEDTDGDGRFDRRTIFAEFEMLAQGSLWLDGSLYVAAAPVIWKLTDADGDGVAEHREKWLETKEVTGCLNDLRGPYLGPDGWIYWGKGPAPQTYQVNGQPWTTTARHIMRRHPDRKDAEQVMVGGMDNVVEVAFSPEGERFVTVTNFHHLGQPRKDGILHAVYGGIYPKDISPVFGFPWSGPKLLPEMVHQGALSPCGLMRYETNQFGEAYPDNLFSCLFSGHKVQRHVLKPNGATFSAHTEDFLTTEDVQFHPTDVLEDADGSLLVIETGGWYLHCCPSSTFYRPERHGAIYRIRREGSHNIEDPRGRNLDWKPPPIAELAARLAEERKTVHQRAIHELGRRGEASLPALRAILEGKPASSPQTRLAAVWSATRIDQHAARAVVRLALDDADKTVRHAAVSSISLWRDREAVPKLLAMLNQPSPQIRRVVAEALGRIGNPSAVPGLLEATSQPADPFLEHSLTFALIEIADPKATQAGLESSSVHTRRAAMIALDQMPGGTLNPKLVIAELDSSEAEMQEAAWWIVSRHSREWGGLLADKIRARLHEGSLSDSERQILVVRLAQVARAPELSAWIVKELTRAGTSLETQILLLEAMANASQQSAVADAGLHYADDRWIEAMLDLLGKNRDQKVTAAAVAALKNRPPIRSTDNGRQLKQSMDARLIATGRRSDLKDETRLTALSAAGKTIGKIDDQLFAFLLTKIHPEESLPVRTMAAEVLSHSQLSPLQLRRLTGSMKNLAATELNALLDLFADQKEDSIGERLVGSLLASSSATTLNAFRLRNCLAGFGPQVHKQAAPLFERLEQAQAEQLAKAQRVLERIPKADQQRGQQVFRGNRAACASCHKTAHVGGAIGPNLRAIGQRRSERDLVESILFPSASLVQGYETWTVLTTDGRIIHGVIQQDTPHDLVLSAGPEKTVRIPRTAIEEMTRSQTSIMPNGLDKTLTDQQLADLIAYLKSLR